MELRSGPSMVRPVAQGHNVALRTGRQPLQLPCHRADHRTSSCSRAAVIVPTHNARLGQGGEARWSPKSTSFCSIPEDPTRMTFSGDETVTLGEGRGDEGDKQKKIRKRKKNEKNEVRLMFMKEMGDSCY
ncbi:hypothetical protein PR202_ga10713 [Eleusine coracana subsp. coracana]|uniref:Uncharacterized protein n=1 Tax=Eleusine coracana subsp. coracana TaxID=191504 RepID=A0AAV5C7M9_ELECO|nr:hypothetical protein PR202_ga10713 [Eleusine coracana subsp. coracana]